MEINGYLVALKDETTQRAEDKPIKNWWVDTYSKDIKSETRIEKKQKGFGFSPKHKSNSNK